VTELINILKINSKNIILIDSDIRKNKDEINDTKKRVIDEVEKFNGFTWVTYGKEIENYIPITTLKKTYHDEIPELKRYQIINNYLDKIDKGLGDKFKNNKVKYAKIFCENITKEDVDGNKELSNKITDVIKYIREANNI
jgi:hypothetical protein